MIEINQTDLKVTTFPDGQTHVNLLGLLRAGDEIRYVTTTQRAQDLIVLMQVSDAINRMGGIKSELIITYLSGARYDRIMTEGDSLDIKVVANLINSCGFKKVKILDPHSDVSLALIDNSEAITNQFLVEGYNEPNAVLIVPDSGAAKKIGNYITWNRNIKDVVHCVKHRDVESGKIQLQVLDREKCLGRNCVIIDDICDGGATFHAIAEQIMPKHLTLIATHGIFSHGIGKFNLNFNKIITSDGYKRDYLPLVDVIPFRP